jgi:hypothetical protein
MVKTLTYSSQFAQTFSYKKPYLCDYWSKLAKEHMYSDYIEHVKHNESIIFGI